jgi:hypothetical protein
MAVLTVLTVVVVVVVVVVDTRAAVEPAQHLAVGARLRSPMVGEVAPGCS